MRRVLLGLLGVVIASDAFAADWLRGSSYEGPSRYEEASSDYNWGGVYIGGQWGFANADFDFTKSTRGLVADMARALLVEEEARISELPKLGRTDARGSAFGGFVGYNAQWGAAILGVELNYNRTSISSSATDLIERAFVTSNEFRNDVSITSSASVHLTDYATARLRAGYAAGWFMPYAMVGLAAGRMDYTRSVSLSIVETDVSAPALDPTDGIPPRPGGVLIDSRSESKNGAITFGYSAGFGVDIGLLQNFFIRGEYEFVQLNPIAGIAVHINTFRAAAAVKF